MKCKCGYQNRENAVFCAGCGRKLNVKKTSTLQKVLKVILVLLIVALCYVICRGQETNEQPNGSIITYGEDRVTSTWTDQTVEFSLKDGKVVDCTVLALDSKIENCNSVTLCLSINELKSGNVLGEWGFYIRDLDGNWLLADTFILDGDYVEAHLEFDKPLSFDAWACPCHVLGDEWEFGFSVWLQDATVFEYVD